MLSSSLYTTLKLSKTTSSQKLFQSDCITLYSNIKNWICRRKQNIFNFQTATNYFYLSFFQVLFSISNTPLLVHKEINFFCDGRSIYAIAPPIDTQSAGILLKKSSSRESHIPSLYLYSEAIYQSALLCGWNSNIIPWYSECWRCWWQKLWWPWSHCHKSPPLSSQTRPAQERVRGFQGYIFCKILWWGGEEKWLLGKMETEGFGKKVIKKGKGKKKKNGLKPALKTIFKVKKFFVYFHGGGVESTVVGEKNYGL